MSSEDVPPRPELTRSPDLASILHRNIGVLHERRRREAASESRETRLARAITDFTGSMAFVYVHLAMCGAWIVVNLGWVPGLPRFDPTFVILAMVASVEAIFLSTFVLISQNRMMADAERRNELDLQINLLAEHEITRLIALVTDIADKLGIEAARDPELRELSRDVAPEAVLDEISSEQDHDHEAARRSPPPSPPS
ncbi:DUF1003 domain-containing protein [Caulobacter sp. 17J80-11]|uniref:DUF1003 domain-containing protein n=1 Tax=Caulobacter sp. 17J80-11 TaxID=2763502 RepID=UPI001653AD2D|nr:DUF1003 domain-containing protein [Caulobacter sp. 17J80-11]MBC6982685.1 DUF1003 domain-containing protein [Caulobacter sp. 17J80-11]